ncbi:hypothetical protein BdWA1_000915 [Babesia duncani]|uniref:Uncharacterized protein n=1 Tax=Babesia duncani TaxID=323732 RepID=A0AAD9PP08_9APIC|nr:hypothetical protein BdWA1_000915 [Babesia duncani]
MVAKQHQRHRYKVLRKLIPVLEESVNRKLINKQSKIDRLRKKYYGTRLSQKLGDGGTIPKLDPGALNRKQCIQDYYKSYPQERFDPQLLATVVKDPTATAGEFKDKKPIANSVFYGPRPIFHEEVKYIQASKGVCSIRALYQSLDKRERDTRGYNGLLAEVLFTRLSKEHLDELRQTEIDVKQDKLGSTTPLLLPKHKRDNIDPQNAIDAFKRHAMSLTSQRF